MCLLSVTREAILHMKAPLSSAICGIRWSIMLLMHAGDRIGILPIDDFANTSAKSPFVTGNGTWLAAPSAVLMGTHGNTTHAVLLSLGNPTYDRLSKVCKSNAWTVLCILCREKYSQLRCMASKWAATSEVQRLLSRALLRGWPCVQCMHCRTCMCCSQRMKCSDVVTRA